MIAKPHTIDEDLQWLPGAIASVARCGADGHVEPLLQMTRQVFSTAWYLRVASEEDPVEEDDRRVVFLVEAPLSAEEALQRVQEWYRRLFAICPAEHAVYFRLALRVTE
jgi:hypothetical protein